MSPATEALRQDIDEIRGSMTETLEHLEARLRSNVDSTMDQVRESLNLERHVVERPWLTLGLATLAGYILGSLDEGPYDGADEPRAFVGDRGEAAGGELGAITSAAAATVAGILRESLAASLPHFDEEYARARQERGW